MKTITNRNRSLAIAALLLVFGAALTGCAGNAAGDSTSSPAAGGDSSVNNAGGDSAANNDSNSGTEVKTIRVGGGNAYNPACYLDENGEPAGYDYAVLKAIDELLPQYEFTYETFDFQNVVLALENNRIDLAAHQYEWNEDREKNYLFGDEGYTVFTNYIWVKDDTDTTNIHSLEDFAGKTVYTTGAGSNVAYYLEKYNAEHPGKELVLDYSTPSTTEEMMTYLATGKWAFGVYAAKDANTLNETYGDIVTLKKAFEEPLNATLTYFLYRKDDPESQQLKEDVDGALRELKESGRLSEIAIEYWGEDASGIDIDPSLTDRGAAASNAE